MTIASTGGTVTLGLYDTQSQLKEKADITYVDNKVDPLVGGHKGFSTLVQAQAAQSGLAANTVVEVLSDTTEANNGYYLWNGTTLTKTTFSPLTQANNYTDSKVATAKAEAISTASSDATTKSNNAVTSSNNYTDSVFAEVPSVVEPYVVQAQAAATAANIAGKVYATPSEGVDPVSGVPSGQYFNVRSISNDNYIDEYLNNSGVAQSTGKSYPSSSFVNSIAEFTALPFNSGSSYDVNQRVQLSNGDIVKSTVANNSVNPNVDMTGWVKTNDASQIFDASGKTQQDINNSLKLKTFADLKAFTLNFDKQTVYVGQRSDIYIYGGGFFKADKTDATSQDNDGTILVGADGTRWKRQWNTHADPCWFGADYTGAVDCSPQVQKAVDVSYGRVWFGNADRSFKMTTPVGLPTNSLVGEMLMEICGDGARIWVYSDTGVFTSKRSIGFETSTGDLYTAVLEFGRGLRFQGDGTSQSVVINGDRLYNVNMKGGRYLRISALVKAAQPRRTEATGYVQSVTVEGNHLGLCNRIIDSKRGFNINVNRNFGESCYGGIYVDGDNSPAINVIRCEGNLWESSGVFAKLGSVYAGTFIGNYFEGNSAGDIPTMKCLIELGKTGTTAYSSGVSFIGNQFGAATAYKTDTAYIDVKFTSSFSGTSLDTLQPPVFIGNWTNGYRMWSEGQVVTQFGNAFSGGNSRRHLAPKLHTEARVTFDLSRKEFLSSTYLVGDVHTVCELETSFISNLVSQTARSCSADLNIFMQIKNANNVVLGAAVAKVSLVVQGSEGIGTGATTDVYVGAALTGFTQLTSGVIDTVNNISLQQHFTNASLTIERVGTKYLLKLSGFTAPSAGVYGSSSKVYSNSTMMIYSLNSGASFAGQIYPT